MSKKEQYFTQISPGTKIQGEIIVENDLRIGGQLEGSLKSTGNLVLENSGKINGNLDIASATIVGNINGNIICKGKLVLEANSHVQGDIQTKELVIHEGARFDGNCKMSTTTPSK